MKIQLLESGEYLELAKDAKLEITKQNPYFTFGEKGKERTTEISIPATSHNAQVLRFAQIPATGGTPVRVKYNAVINADSATFKGTLHFTDYNPKDKCYNAVFTFRNYDIFSILDSINVKDIVNTEDLIVVYNNDIRPAYDIGTRDKNFCKRVYFNNAENAAGVIHYLPTYYVYFILELINAGLEREGYADAYVHPSGDTFAYLYYLPNTLYCFNKRGYVTIRRPYDPRDLVMIDRGYHNVTYSGFYYNFVKEHLEYLFCVSRTTPNNEIRSEVNPLFGYTDDWNQVYLDYRDYILSFPYMVALKDTEITFPKDTPNTYCVKKPLYQVGYDGGDYSKHFYGDHWFDLALALDPDRDPMTPPPTPELHGEGLAGKTIFIKEGEAFAIVEPDDWIIYKDYYLDPSYWPPYHDHYYYEVRKPRYPDFRGWKYESYFYIDGTHYRVQDKYFSFHVKTDLSVKCNYAEAQLIEESVGAYCNPHGIAFANANLPDMSILAFYKELVNLYSYVSWYDSADKWLYIDYPPDNEHTTRQLTKMDISDSILQIKTVERTFAKFKQKNFIKYKNSDEPIVTFEVQNETLEMENKIYELKESPTGMVTITIESGTNDYARVVYEDLEDRSKYGPCFLRASTEPDDHYCHYMPLQNNNTLLTRLCAQSTKVEVEVAMPLFRYERVTKETLLYIKGTYYIWTESTWSDGIATFTLQKY